MRKFVCIVLFWIVSAVAIAQENLFVWGVVKWDTGTPAAGVEVRLVQEGEVRAQTYTNQAGRYGFFNIAGQPSEYTLEAVLADEVVGAQTLPELAIGGRAPDLIIQ